MSNITPETLLTFLNYERKAWSLSMKKEYFNLPNLMGYFRIILLPVFLFVYYNASTPSGYVAAFMILAVSFLTDLLDGKVARRFNMVTDFGKILDPLADKLTQGALAFAATLRYPFMKLFLVLFLCRELYMALMGLFLLKHRNVCNGAQWYGKVCTTMIDAGVFILLFPGIPYQAANIIIIVMTICLLVTWLKYIQFHTGIIREKTSSHKRKEKYFMLFCILFLLYIILGAIVPYRKEPEVSAAFQEQLQGEMEQFYAGKSSCDRALVVEDNEEALAERIRLIEQAQEHIILSTFDFRSDTAGKQVIAALLAASDRNVSIEILVDGFNFLMQMRGNPYFYALTARDNVTVKVYNPVNILTPWKIMSRMHDKYVIADDSLYLLGGRNTFNYFLGGQEGYKNYDRDVLVYNTGGTESSVCQIRRYFEGIWNQKECKRWKPGKWLTDTHAVNETTQDLYEIYTAMHIEHKDWFVNTDYESVTLPVNSIMLLSNPTGLYCKEPQVFYGLSKLMGNAKKSVLIHTPYIMCNDMMYDTFHQLDQYGIPITLMTNSVTNNGNAFGAVDYALHKEELLDTGLHILEYEGGVSYHGKSVVIDDNIAVIGSFNMDMKSVYQDTEMMLVINSKELTAQLSANLESYQKDASEAKLTGKISEELYGEGVSMPQKLQRFFIRLLDRPFRFLL